MKSKKKLYGILLLPALALGAAIGGVAASIARFNVNESIALEGDAVASVTVGDVTTNYDAIADALTAWGDGATLTLLKDATVLISVSSGEKTLDLNNHVLTNTSNLVIDVTGGHLHIQDTAETKTTHYYVPNTKAPATLSDTPSDYSFEGGYVAGGALTRIMSITETGTVTFSSGTLFGNKGAAGAGASVGAGATLNLEGTAAIIGNYYDEPNYPWGHSGGLSIGGTFNMTGGKVAHNSSPTGVGGFRVSDNATFVMTGGEVYGNSGSNYLAGGIHCNGKTTIKIGGSAKIYDNVCNGTPRNLGLSNGYTCEIAEPFVEGADVHIFPGVDIADDSQGKATAANPISIVTNWATVMGEVDPYDYLTCDPIYNRALNAVLANYEVYTKDGKVVGSPVSYAVSFDGNSGTGTMTGTTVTQRGYKLPDNAFTAPKYKTFSGWTVGDGTKLYQPGETAVLSGDTVIHAQWKDVALVTLMPGEGSGETKIEGVYDAENKFELPEPTFDAPEGKRFLGWRWVEDGKLYSPGVIVTIGSSTSFTAEWVGDFTPDWFGVSGKVYASDGTALVANAKVYLYRGSELVDFATTDTYGEYKFIAPNGSYNIVAEYGEVTNTVIADIFNDKVVRDIILSDGKTQSFLNVEDGLDVAVGGLEAEAKAIRTKAGVAEDVNVAVTMNVEAKAPAEAAHGGDIASEYPEKDLEFLEIKVEKTVGETVTALEETEGVIEIVVPYANVNKREVAVISYHGDAVKTYTEANTKADGTFILDKDNGLVRIYTKQFSTFAIGYTPYFNIGATISLGSYTGLVTAKLENLTTKETVALLENVALNEVAFKDLKKGDYLLTITWVDGVSNSITMNFSL